MDSPLSEIQVGEICIDLLGLYSVKLAGGASKILADAIEEGLILGPRLYQCGKALSQTGDLCIRLPVMT